MEKISLIIEITWKTKYNDVLQGLKDISRSNLKKEKGDKFKI